MEHILVFGGTGDTGKEIINQALAQGFAVTAVVRDPCFMVNTTSIINHLPRRRAAACNF